MTASSAKAQEPRIVVAPLPPAAGKNAYHDLFYGALAPLGIERLREVEYDLDWFQQNARWIDWVHIHFTIYYYNNRSLWLTLTQGLAFIRFLWRLRRMGLRIAWTCHNLFPHESRSRAVDYLVRLVLAHVSDFVIVHSLAAKRGVRRCFGRFRGVVYVPLGHMVGHYPNTVSRDEARARLGVPGGATVYLLLGNIRPYKGVEELIEAFKQLPDPDSILLLAGSVAPEFGQPEVQHYRASLLERIAGDARIRAHFELVPDEDLQLYFNAADLAVLPFRKVLTSASLILALSFGVPVVMPRIASIMEYVNDRVAYLMAPGERLDEALARARARRRSGALEAGQPVVDWVSRFDWNTGARVVAEAFRRGGRVSRRT